jgi:hypothetical protein
LRPPGPNYDDLAVTTKKSNLLIICLAAGCTGLIAVPAAGAASGPAL